MPSTNLNPPVTATPEELFRGSVPFDTSISFFCGTVHKVFTREGSARFLHQNLSVRVGSNGQRILVRLHDREAVSETVAGSTIEIRSRPDTPRAVVWEKDVSPNSPGRLVVRKNALVSFPQTTTPAVGTSQTSKGEMPPPAERRPAPSRQRLTLEGFGESLQQADLLIRSFAVGDLAYLIADGPTRAAAVLQLTGFFLEHPAFLEDVAAKPAGSATPNRDKLLALAARSDDAAGSYRFLAQCRGFLAGDAALDSISEADAGQMLTLVNGCPSPQPS